MQEDIPQQAVCNLRREFGEHGARTLVIASRLLAMGVNVSYPGLPSHPQYNLMSRIINQGYGHGGVMTIDCETSNRAEDLMADLQNEERFGFLL